MRDSSRPAVLLVVTMETNKPAKRHHRVSLLSPHYIMLIRPQQTLPLARNNRILLIFNYIFKI